MANRVLIGNRSTGGYGLYVSKNGEDVLTTTNSLAFDSRMGASAIVHSYAQGTLAAGADYDITHNLGYQPLYAMRWTDEGDISSGVATKAYSPNTADSQFVIMEGDEVDDEGEVSWGCYARHNGNNAITIESNSGGDQGNTTVIYYAIVIFHEADYSGGQGL